MSKAYLIMPVNFAYDDEVHSVEGFEKPHSNTVYVSKQVAEKEAERLNFNFIREHFHYFFENLSSYKFESAQEKLKYLYPDKDYIWRNRWDWELPKDITIEEYRNLRQVFELEGIDLDGFQVVEVDVDGRT